MDIDKTTYEYYSHWTGIDLCGINNGLYYRHNIERDNIPKGYSKKIDLYIFVNDNLTVISYGNSIKEAIEKSTDKIRKLNRIESIKLFLENIFQKEINHNIKYIYRKRIKNKMNVEILKPDQSELFIDFFKTNNPNIKEYSWVKDYFIDMASKRFCHGIILDNKLVSANDAPDMPYMSNIVQEIGINTINEYRGKGYAREVCISFIDELLSRNICPLWSTTKANIASDRLAKSIGFEKLADIYTMNME
jgi:RimJ/RimL family protein N-acetyltransferase